MPSVTLRFYEELNDFLPPEKRKRAFARPITGSPAVRAVIEAEGVPQAQVDLVLVNGESVGFEHRLRESDRVAVYPVFEALEIGLLQRLRARPLREPRFVLDRHLETLAQRLRRLGFDSVYGDDWEGAAVLEVAAREHRIVLTRDAGLLENPSVTRGYRLRASDPDEQVREVLERFDLRSRPGPASARGPGAPSFSQRS